MTNQYFINSVDLYTEYGITVLKSTGEIDLPKIKDRLVIDWPDEHGQAADLGLTYVGPREITLECMLKQANKAAANTKMAALSAMLIGSGVKEFRSLKTTPKIHIVSLADGINVERFNGGKVLLFKVKLTEYEPINRQWQIDVISIHDTVTVNCGTGATGPLTVYWGGVKEIVITSKTKAFSTIGTTPKIVVAGDFTKTPNFSISAYINGTTVTPVEL